MQTATLEMDWCEARQKHAEYRRALKDMANQREAEALQAQAKAYRELSLGNTVIDLYETIRRGGVDALGRPKLAAIRADAKLCWYRSNAPGPKFGDRSEFHYSRGYRREPKGVKSVIALPTGWLPRLHNGRAVYARAVVPTIPPLLMPAGDLSRYVILWEAEWESLPVDPMLLRPLGKNLYVVLAQWDLTPVERAVLYDRL